MTETAKADERLIAAYVRLVLGEAQFEDERLALLRTLMTHDEREQAAAAIALEILKREPPAKWAKGEGERHEIHS